MTGIGASWRVRNYAAKERLLRAFAAALAQPRLDVAQMRAARAELQAQFGNDVVVDATCIVAYFAAISRLVDSTNHRMIQSSKSTASKLRSAVALSAAVGVLAVGALAVARWWRN